MVAILASLVLWAGGAYRAGGASPHAARAALSVHVSGNRLVDGSGHTVVLRGANRSGTEYLCTSSRAFADGPIGAASLAAMKSWGLNAVRVPLNEDCWLGINGVALGGAAYQDDVRRFVARIIAAGMYPILDLHFSAPGAIKATSQQPMPDMDHSPAFWRSVAATFGHDDAVIFDLYNEPYPRGDTDGAAAWACWRDGCRETAQGNISYRAAGMQRLVDTVRAAGATNVLMAGGVQFANVLNDWIAYRPSDPLHNLAAAQHFYFDSGCGAAACWNSTTAVVARRFPVIAGEVGDTDCTINNTRDVLDFLEAHGISYLGWDWGTDFGCQSLIKSFDGTPSQPYGQWFHDRVLRAEGRPVRPSPLSALYDNTGVVADHQQEYCGFDDQNYCYSAQALAVAGLLPGGVIHYNGATLTWDPPLGSADNILAAGQTVAISPTVAGATALAILGAATHGPARGVITLAYADGSTATATIDFSDWLLGGGTQAIEPGNTPIVTAAYRDKSDGTTQAGRVYLFGVSIPLDSGRMLRSIRMPAPAANPYAPTIHIFALAETVPSR